MADAWRSGADRDWSVPAGTLEWSCSKTADHAVDTVFAPALFLASRKLDGYPGYGMHTPGPDAAPALLVEALETAARVLVAVVGAAPADARAVIWRRPQIETARTGRLRAPRQRSSSSCMPTMSAPDSVSRSIRPPTSVSGSANTRSPGRTGSRPDGRPSRWRAIHGPISSSASGRPQCIYHLALRNEWEEAVERNGPYRRSTLGRSLDDEGFIHCSFAHQVEMIADLVFRGRDVVLLTIDPSPRARRPPRREPRRWRRPVPTRLRRRSARRGGRRRSKVL